MTEETAPQTKPQSSSRTTTIAIVAAVAAAAWGIFEFRHGRQLADELSDLNMKHTQLQHQLSDRDQQLESVTTKLNELAQRTLPVSVLFRPSASGVGLTAMFKNNAPAPVEIGVLLTNPATNRRREVNLSIAANGVQSIGDPEGWTFSPGQRIQVTHSQFGTIYYVVPDK